jgi:hypothetical protein
MEKKFTLIATIKDGYVNFQSSAEGDISAMEIAGILEMKRLDIFNQLSKGTLFERIRTNTDGSVERIIEKQD